MVIVVVSAVSSDEESLSTACFRAAVLTLRKIGIVDVGADLGTSKNLIIDRAYFGLT